MKRKIICAALLIAMFYTNISIVSAQNLLNNGICTPDELVAACFPLRTYKCPDLGIPNSQYSEIASCLPQSGGCLMRPLDVHTTVDAYRTLWKQEQQRNEQILNAWADDRTKLLVSQAKMSRACGRKCKSIKLNNR